MNKGGMAVLAVAAIVFAGLGFAFGQVVRAANGSGPVVTEAWVEQYVGQRLADMQQNMDRLEEQLLAGNPGSGASGATIPEPGDNPTTPTTPTTPTFSTVKVKSNSLNVRSDASESASVVGSVTSNTTLTYLGQKNDSQGRTWYKVRLSNDTEGWVAGWHCYDPQ